MFSRKSLPPTKPKKTLMTRDSHAVTIMTNGCHFTGKLVCKGSTRIAGKLEGQIISEGFLVIEEGAEIHADIKAQDAVIQGKVIGTIQATSRVELSPSCHFEGEITTPSIVIHEGAHFTGQTHMAPKEEPQKILPKTIPVSPSNKSTLKVPEFEGLTRNESHLKAPEIRVPTVS